MWQNKICRKDRYEMYDFKFQKWNHADNINISINSSLEIQQNKNLKRKAFLWKTVYFLFQFSGDMRKITK